MLAFVGHTEMIGKCLAQRLCHPHGWRGCERDLQAIFGRTLLVLFELALALFSPSLPGPLLLSLLPLPFLLSCDRALQ